MIAFNFQLSNQEILNLLLHQLHIFATAPSLPPTSVSAIGHCGFLWQRRTQDKLKTNCEGRIEQKLKCISILESLYH